MLDLRYCSVIVGDQGQEDGDANADQHQEGNTPGQAFQEPSHMLFMKSRDVKLEPIDMEEVDDSKPTAYVEVDAGIFGKVGVSKCVRFKYGCMHFAENSRELGEEIVERFGCLFKKPKLPDSIKCCIEGCSYEG